MYFIGCINFIHKVHIVIFIYVKIESILYLFTLVKLICFINQIEFNIYFNSLKIVLALLKI